MRWVNAKSEYTISWTVLPHKRSINLGIFKHPGYNVRPSSTHSSSSALPPPSPNLEAVEGRKDVRDSASAVIEKLKNIGLKQVKWIGKCEADKATQGKYDVPTGEAGNYALVFDNMFSKNTSKTATVFLLTYPTACQSQIHFGIQVHHSSAMATALALAPSFSKRSPKLRARGQESLDSLRQVSASQPLPDITSPVPDMKSLSEESTSIHTGVLQKRRRKRHQGYARRFFCLDYTSSTMSYYHDRNSSALRGAIPLSLAAIGANAKTREISIDSGAEIWHLRANNKADFDEWKKALETASRMLFEAKTPSATLSLQTGSYTPHYNPFAENQDWARLETLLSRISGTRDAVRRLCLETLAQSTPPAQLGAGSGPTTPMDLASDEYFKQEERKSFWKRKPSTNTPQHNNPLKRSVSAQLAVPLPGAEPILRKGSQIPAHHSGSPHEEGMYDHCKAMLHDLDSVVSEFSTLLTQSKQRRAHAPRSAVSRMSVQSIESQEYFDAEDKMNSALLDIQDDSDTEERSDKEAAVADDDSATSSDVEDITGSNARGRAFTSGSISSLFPSKPKSLTPLPLQPVQRRQSIEPPRIMPPSLIGFLRKNVGKDLSTISMPVSANEPTSLLQRASEQLEYSELLDRAARSTDAVERLIYVTAFAISSFSNTRIKERSIRKPFNPMLGETFELVREDKGFRLVSEKVSHHPVQLAFQADSTDWSFTQSPRPTQKFWGKSSEINTEGKARVVLHPSSECLSWSVATCFLRNIIAGEKYVEPVGTMTVFNDTTSHKAVVTFKAKGMFSGRSEEVDVQTFDAHGSELPLGLQGTWTQSLQIKEHGTPTKTDVWKAGPLVPQAAKHYGMTAFAATLNEVTTIEEGKLPPTDSRLRPDQKALEQGDHDQAEQLKNLLEEAQRARRRDMESRDESWKPKWFVKVENGDEVAWKLKGGKDSYWDERSKGDWTSVVPVLDV